MVKTIGKYELHRTLGEGSFGKVKYAVNKETNDAVAIKVLDKDMLRKKNMSVQIKREISLMRMINHKHVISIKDVFATATKIFMVLELVEGGELFDKIVEQGKFPEPIARFYMRQLIDGMECCHNQGICHRDLKPENLLLDAQGNLKISDFGMARLYIGDPDAAGEARAELLHTTCGTPNYVAPEVLTCQGYDGQKADVWSMGVILYVLLAGYLPFEESTTAALFKKIKTADFEYPKWFSESVRELLSRVLVVDPDLRISLRELKVSSWITNEDCPPPERPPYPRNGEFDGKDKAGMSDDEDDKGKDKSKDKEKEKEKEAEKEHEARRHESHARVMHNPAYIQAHPEAAAEVPHISAAAQRAHHPAETVEATSSAATSTTPLTAAVSSGSTAPTPAPVPAAQPAPAPAAVPASKPTPGPAANTTLNGVKSSDAIVPTISKPEVLPAAVNALAATGSDEALVPTVIKGTGSMQISAAPPPHPAPSPRGAPVNRIPSYDVSQSKSATGSTVNGAVKKEYEAAVRPASPLPVVESKPAVPPATTTAATKVATVTPTIEPPAPSTPAPKTASGSQPKESAPTIGASAGAPVASPGLGTPVGATPAPAKGPESNGHRQPRRQDPIDEVEIESSSISTQLSTAAGIFECICNPFASFSTKPSVRLQ